MKKMCGFNQKTIFSFFLLVIYYLEGMQDCVLQTIVPLDNCFIQQQVLQTQGRQPFHPTILCTIQIYIFSLSGPRSIVCVAEC